MLRSLLSQLRPFSRRFSTFKSHDDPNKLLPPQILNSAHHPIPNQWKIPPEVSFPVSVLPKDGTLFGDQPIPILSETKNGRVVVFSVNKDGVLITRIDRKSNAIHARVKNFLFSVFMPIGYPTSVHPTYLKHHLWAMVESFFSSIFFVFSNETMLDSLGVGGAQAAAGAVAIQWVLKDGLGEFGKLFINQYFAKYFDSRPKTFKLLGEIILITGYGFMMLCALYPSHFLLFASIGNALRVASFMIWGATSAYFFRNFSLSQNMGDIMSKFESQSVVANLSGFGAGIALISLSSDPCFLLSLFVTITPFYLFSTIASLEAVTIEVLNETKIMKLVSVWAENGIILSPQELKKQEILFGEWEREYSRVDLGVSIGIVLERNELDRVLNIFGEESYLLMLRKNGTIGIVLHHGVLQDDVFKALFHAVKICWAIKTHKNAKDIRSGLQAVNFDEFFSFVQSLFPTTRSDFAQFMAALKRAGWDADSIAWVDHGIRATWHPIRSN